MTRRVYDHLERHPRQRIALLALAGLALFALGAAYIRLQRRPDPLTHQVTGGDLLAPGWPLALRVRARSAHAGAAAIPDVEAVTVAGRSVAFEEVRGDPTRVTVALPEDLPIGNGPVAVALQLAGAHMPNPLALRLGATLADPGGAPQRRPPPRPRPTKRAVRVELQPARGDLVSNLPNQVFARVTDPAGLPLVGATVRVRHAELPRVEALAPTDTDGLTSFELKPRRPNYDVRAEVSHASLGPDAVETIQPLYAAGRQLGVDGLPPVVRPGTAQPVTLLTDRDGDAVHCDLRRGRLHLAAWQVDPGPRGEAALTLPALTSTGRHDLDCYFHVLMPGSTSLSRAFWVGDPDDPRQLLEAGVEAGLLPRGALPSADTRSGPASGLGPPGSAAPGARADPAALRWPWLVARLSEPEVASPLLLNTTREAVRAADEAWEDRKAVALGSLAGAIALLLLVGLDLALSHALANRARLRAWEAEAAASGELGPSSTDGLDPVAHLSTDRLARTRGWLLLIVAVGTVVANVMGFLLLSGMFLN
jgi:hypothetical protein